MPETSTLKNIFVYAQYLAIILLALFITGEKIKRWHYGRSGKDRRAANGNNDYNTHGSLKRIEKSLKAVALSVGKVHKRVDDSVLEITKVQTTVQEQKEQCRLTVGRFDETIANQNKSILDLAMKE